MRRLVLTTVLAACLGLNAAQAAEIKILSSGAYKPVIVAMAAEFERRSGHKLVVENDTAGALAQRIAKGEAFDVAVLPPGALQPLVESGKIAAGAARPLARVAIGVAVRNGAQKPDIGSVAAFKQALIEARHVAYIDPAAGGSSGIYLAQLFERMGIAEAIKAKAVLVPGGLVAARLLNGEADLAVHQVSEILAVPGATLVGPIPSEIQNYTVYAGGIATAARDAKAAADILSFLAGDEARAVLAAKGMEPAAP